MLHIMLWYYVTWIIKLHIYHVVISYKVDDTALLSILLVRYHDLETAVGAWTFWIRYSHNQLAQELTIRIIKTMNFTLESAYVGCLCVILSSVFKVFLHANTKYKWGSVMLPHWRGDLGTSSTLWRILLSCEVSLELYLHKSISGNLSILQYGLGSLE